MIDQKILALKIKVAEDRLAYLRSLLPERPPADSTAVASPIPDWQSDVPLKRGPGRPKKAA